MAQLPFHYYLALREDWIKSNTVVTDEDDGSGRLSESDVIDFNAKSLVGEMV